MKTSVKMLDSSWLAVSLYLIWKMNSVFEIRIVWAKTTCRFIGILILLKRHSMISCFCFLVVGKNCLFKIHEVWQCNMCWGMAAAMRCLFYAWPLVQMQNQLEAILGADNNQWQFLECYQPVSKYYTIRLEMAIKKSPL